MKKAFLLLFIAFASTGFSQTATNFTVNDCNGINHDLFTELDAGKVVVICWVMPCSSCIATAATDANIVQSYAGTYPGRVKFYLCDDAGNTPCHTLVNWAAANGIVPDAIFDNVGGPISMNNYGGASMPKTVVLGGSSHQVFYNADGAINSTSEQNAINAALAATGVNENTIPVSGLSLYPNPAKNIPVTLSYSLSQSNAVTISVFNIFGEKVKSFSEGNQTAGEQQATLDLAALASGIYFVRVEAGESSSVIRFIIAE
jgi:hypothetical protein